MDAFKICRVVVLLLACLVLAPLSAAADQKPEGPPQIEVSQTGATIEDVTIQTYGVIKPDAVRQYLSLKQGDALDQAGVDRDYGNLSKLVGFIPRLEVSPGEAPRTVTLHWIVMAKWLQTTSHPFYADQPLLAPIQGVGFIVTSPQLSRHGANVSSISQLSRRANLVRMLYTNPLHVNATKGRESDFIFDVQAGRGVYRASQPQAINIYSWNDAAEALFYEHSTNGNQLELGFRMNRSTTKQSTDIIAPSIYDTSLHPARTSLLELGYSHACLIPPTRWYPPYCSTQYRFEVLDAIGLFNPTSEYQIFIADAAQYIRAGDSTLVLHAADDRSGGVLPDAFLLCSSGIRGYPKAFCGTDAQTLQAEFRVADAVPGPLHVVVFTETASSRVRGSLVAFAPSSFVWHADSGIGLIYRGFRLDLARGTDGNRLTFELQGQTY